MLYGFGRRRGPPSLPSSVTEALTVFCNLFYGEARPTSERGRPTEHEVNVGLALLRLRGRSQPSIPWVFNVKKEGASSMAKHGKAFKTLGKRNGSFDCEPRY